MQCGALQRVRCSCNACVHVARRYTDVAMPCCCGLPFKVYFPQHAFPLLPPPLKISFEDAVKGKSQAMTVDLSSLGIPGVPRKTVEVKFPPGESSVGGRRWVGRWVGRWVVPGHPWCAPQGGCKSRSRQVCMGWVGGVWGKVSVGKLAVLGAVVRTHGSTHRAAYPQQAHVTSTDTSPPPHPAASYLPTWHAGVDSGHQLRLEGVLPASQGMPAGDLIVEIAVAPSAKFQRDDFDLYVDAPVDFVDAALGTTVE